jgi:alpha-N-arabinofuranosidase
VAIRANVEQGTIRPELHSHFAEHLGTCTYGGLWVGRNSPIPNINGHRKAAVEYLKALGVPVLRWPGGCFADDYHWRDGIGAPEKRPRRVNLWWGGYTEDNSFGTHEFVELCRLIGAEPYFAGNVGSGTPAELREWIEYCNFPKGSTLSDERAANGSSEPFNVKYWGVGNENWGCGGTMTPEEYSGHFRRYATYTGSRNGVLGTRPFLIACGPNRNDLEWTRRFLETSKTRLQQISGFAMHFYQNGREAATKFSVEAMREQFGLIDAMDAAIIQQHGILRGYEPQGRIGMLIDEWGVWDRIQPDDEKRYGKLFQQITMRGAVAAAMGLNVFHRHADKLVMCNIAQIVNVLHAMLLTDGDKCVRTTSYYAFELEKPHRGATALRIDNDDAKPMALSVSASKKDGALAMTFANPSHEETRAVTCSIDGAKAGAATARLLHHSDFNAFNSFEAPDTVTPKSHDVTAAQGGLRFDLPPMSVLTVTAPLA